MLLNDIQIRQRILFESMIEGAELESVRERDGIKRISYGVTHAGYDMRLEGPILVPKKGMIHDPKHSIERKLNEWIPLPIQQNNHGERWVIIPPCSMVLAVSQERFNIPADITATVIGKSTLAREGIIVNCTPMEAGWSGYLTLELINVHYANKIKVYLNEGIACAQFHYHERPSVTYAEKNGKYHNQEAVPVHGRV